VNLGLKGSQLLLHFGTDGFEVLLEFSSKT